MDRDDELRQAHDRQDRIADKHGPRLQRAIAAAMVEVARALPSGGRAEPSAEHFRQIDDAMRAMYRDMTRAEAEAMVDRFKSGFTWLQTKATEDGFYQRLFEEYLQSYGGVRIAQVSETTRRQIVQMVERGLRDGLSVDEIADLIIERAPVVSETRAAIIARTETHSAAMYASINSAKRSTLPLVKEWVSAEDGRTRDFGEGDGIVDEFSHRAMDGVTVPIDDPFEVPTKFGTTEKLMYPGDPAGSAANIINCRCSQVYVPADAVEETEERPPARTDPPTGGDARARLLDEIRGAQSVFSQASDGAFDAAQPLALQAIAKAGDFQRLTFDQRDGAYYIAGKISMGRHAPGTEAYRRVFRHEHGHFIDDQIGQATGTPPFGSWRAVRGMLDDGRELQAQRSKVFQGDPASTASLAARNNEAFLDRVDELVAEISDADDILRRVIPEVEPEDVWRFYGVQQDRNPMAAARIAAAWERRDVGQAIAELPARLSGQRTGHSSPFAGLQDAFEASTGGNVRIAFGHGKRYYTERNSISDFRGQTVRDGRRKVNAYATGQAFANWFEAYGDSNPATYALYRRLYPRTSAEFEAMLEEYVNG